MKIDFYILEASQQKSLHFACGLIEKAYLAQQKLYIHTASREDAERLDTLLWAYRDDSFVPHQLYQAHTDNPAPVQIGFEQPPTDSNTQLINVSQNLPPDYAAFSHLIEIVFSDPVVQQLARERYKHYREQEHDITTYKLKANEI